VQRDSDPEASEEDAENSDDPEEMNPNDVPLDRDELIEEESKKSDIVPEDAPEDEPMDDVES